MYLTFKSILNVIIAVEKLKMNVKYLNRLTCVEYVLSYIIFYCQVQNLACIWSAPLKYAYVYMGFDHLTVNGKLNFYNSDAEIYVYLFRM